MKHEKRNLSEKWNQFTWWLHMHDAEAAALILMVTGIVTIVFLMGVLG